VKVRISMATANRTRGSTSVSEAPVSVLWATAMGQTSSACEYGAGANPNAVAVEDIQR